MQLFRDFVCKNTFRSPFPGIAQYLPKPKYLISLGTLRTKAVVLVVVEAVVVSVHQVSTQSL
jgi:hypothetical protein